MVKVDYGFYKGCSTFTYSIIVHVFENLSKVTKNATGSVRKLAVI